MVYDTQITVLNRVVKLTYKQGGPYCIHQYTYGDYDPSNMWGSRDFQLATTHEMRNSRMMVG